MLGAILHYRGAMRLSFSKVILSNVILGFYLLQILVPLGYMPGAVAGDGWVTLCPDGMGPGSAVLFQAKPKASNASSSSDLDHADHHSAHHSGHHQHQSHQISDAPDLHDGHQASTGADCDYGALAGQNDDLDFEIEFASLVVVVSTAVLHRNNSEVVVRSARHKLARAPPVLFVS